MQFYRVNSLLEILTAYRQGAVGLEELMKALDAGDEVAAQKQLMAEVMGFSVVQETEDE